MSFLGNLGWIEKTSKIGAEELSLEWHIPDILSIPGGSDSCCCSPEFTFGNEPWCLRLWPKCMNESWNPSSGWIRLRLLRVKGGPPQTFNIRLGIKGSKRVEKEREVETELTRFGFHDWNEFCSRFVLMEYKSRLMAQNILIITFAIKTVAPSCTRVNDELSRKRKFPESGEDCILSKEALGKKRALEDYGKLLASEDFSDVIIHVSGVEFRVHRLILSARSPVFSAMFHHQTAERDSNKITIEDCEPDAFKEYLQYLYTGSLQPLSPQTTISLYQVADKYLADNLKQQCVQFIKVQLSVQTFFDVIELALMHGESDLLERAIAFAAENIFLNSFYLKQDLLAR